QNFAAICEQLEGMLRRAAPLPPQDQALTQRTIPKWPFYLAIVAVLGIGFWAVGGVRAVVSYFWPPPKPKPSPTIQPIRDFLPDPIVGDMVLVREGPFLFGEHKEQRVLPNFYIDKTEVTNKAFAEFCRARGLPAPKGNPNYPVVKVKVADAR